MHTHPTFTLNVERRAFEERMGISSRGTSVSRRSYGIAQGITLGEFWTKLQQRVTEYAMALRSPLPAKQTDVPSSAAS